VAVTGRVSARWIGLALAVGTLTAAAAAAGHAVLQRAEPRVEGTLKRAPDEVKLYFSERLEPA
jgi:methionine-rich copper-binding protein CopC